ncbi:hypothetical protein [Streptomyces sp. NPDC088196]|uniref:hypothetical protein n=1 Tax=Streptomyces sp. NPDC088196 TaxID=3154868 RepID=UPI00344B94C8
MTSHAMTLPGLGGIEPPHTAGCRGYRCELLIGPAHRDDTMSAWHATLRGGAPAMDSYLAQYNAAFQAAHSGSCRFRELPPSVHVACAGDYEALEAELEWANKARFEFNR